MSDLVAFVFGACVEFSTKSAGIILMQAPFYIALSYAS